MPSTTSSSFCRDLPSSTVITPSLPTLSIALAMISPMLESELAEMEPTWAISLEVVVALEAFFSSSIRAVTALSMPRFRSMGFMPAATYFMPSRTMAWASTVAVVVPSPALSDVLEATSLATDTPSLVTVGAPNERSSTTLRPLGPRVTLTALARMFTPSTMRARASPPKMTSFAAILELLKIGFKLAASAYPVSSSSYEKMSGSAGELLLDHCEQIVFLHDQQLVAVDLDSLARVLAEQNAVTDLHVQGDHVALVVLLAGADGQHFTLIGLFSGVVRDHDAGGGRGFAFDTLDDHAIVQRAKVHCNAPVFSKKLTYSAPGGPGATKLPAAEAVLALVCGEC